MSNKVIITILMYAWIIGSAVLLGFGIELSSWPLGIGSGVSMVCGVVAAFTRWVFSD